MTLTFSPMGVATMSGSDDHWGKRTNLKGFRPSLRVSWGYGIRCDHETWNGSTFVPTGQVDTHVSVAKILNSAANQPCLVEPRTSYGLSFLAQPEMEPFNLTDTKGIAYKGVEILLVGTLPVALPTWGI
jgi:hypothetical protein